MASPNGRMTKEFLSITAVSATSEDAEFPKEYAVDRVSPTKEYRTGNTLQTRLVIDLGAAKTDIECYLDYVNFTSFKYQESANGVSGWADVGSTRTVSIDPIHGIYRRRDAITLTSKRYLGILIPAQTPVDNASYFRIGTFCVPVNVAELETQTDIGYPFSMQLSDSHIIDNVYPTGKSESVKLSQLPPLFISFDILTGATYPNMVGPGITQLMNLLRDKTQMLYLDFNLGESWQAYLMRRDSEISSTISLPSLMTINLGSVRFKVIV